MRALLGLCVVASLTSVAAADRMPVHDVAVAIVFNGHEIAMGNDMIETDEAARYPGMLPALARSFDAIDLSRSLPRDAVGVVISYADKAEVRHSMAPFAELRGTRVFGTQQDYYRTIGMDLVAGTELGIAELSHVAATKKFLVVIGDGNATNSDTAAHDLATLRTQARAAGIEPIAVTYKHVLSSPHTDVTALDPEAVHVVTIDSVMSSVRARIEASLAPQPVTLPTRTCGYATSHAAATGSSRGLMLALGGLSLLALLTSGAWLIRREKPGHSR